MERYSVAECEAGAGREGGSSGGEVWVGRGGGEVNRNAQRPAPELAHLAILVGLLWRAVVMWIVLLALLTMARLLG